MLTFTIMNISITQEVYGGDQNSPEKKLRMAALNLDLVRYITKSILCMPICIRGTVIGVVQVIKFTSVKTFGQI